MSFSNINGQAARGANQPSSSKRYFTPLRVTFLIIGAILFLAGIWIITFGPEVESADTITSLNSMDFGTFLMDKGRMFLIIIGMVIMALSVFKVKK